MGATFEEQINNLINQGKELIGETINLPPAPGKPRRGRKNMGGSMTRPEGAESSGFFRDPTERVPYDELLARREILAGERRAYAYANPGYTGGTIVRGGGGGGGGGGGAANGNGSWTDPKLLWAGGLALILFMLYKKKTG